MSKFGLITPCGPVDDPLSHFRTALLTVAMALAMIVCAELSIDRPRMTHAIKIDLPFVQADAPPPHLVRPMHVLVIRADGSMTFTGAPVADLRQLRRLVDLDQTRTPLPMLRLEPDPRLRYADFLEVLAVIKRAHVYQYCIDFDPERQLGDFQCAPRPWLE